MKLEEKLYLLRKKNGYSQEQLADKLGIARQTVSKWETGQAVPEIYAFVQLSNLYRVTIDSLLKEENCSIAVFADEDINTKKVISFLMEAKRNSYAGHGTETDSCRPLSHDLEYHKEKYHYYDTYLGRQNFSGEEAVWYEGQPIWAMNYCGRTLAESFSGDFLKEALYQVPEDKPYRGPALYRNGDYSYHCMVKGEFTWYQGYEEIFYRDDKIYECYFHGGSVR